MNSENQNIEQNNEDSLKLLREQVNNLEALRIVLRDKKITENILKHFDYNSARTHLVDRFNLNKEQAEFILNMPFEELHNLTLEEIEDQYTGLVKAYRSTVYLRPLWESEAWSKSKADIPIPLGLDIAGNVCMTDLAKISHLFVAGATGSGKSMCMNSLITSLLLKFSPDELNLIMVDPKVVEFEMFDSIPHLITPIMNDPEKVPQALHWTLNEIERRFKALEKVKAKNWKDFNAKSTKQKLSILIVIIDELSDLMMSDAKKDVEQCICQIAQKGHDVGVHLIVATQAPRKEVITDLIKENIPAKIAFRVCNKMDSHVIMDAPGAEKLIGNGDMLFVSAESKVPKRIQGAYISDKEIEKILDNDVAQRLPSFDESIAGPLDKSTIRTEDEKDDENDISADPDVIKAVADKYLLPDDPPIMTKALEIIISEQQVSTSYLQRKLRIGYNQAAEIMDKLEQRHVVSATLPGGQKRVILINNSIESTERGSE
ncbi:MAG: FtsK/SpoIIIE domain-containing protein [Lentisphaeria bacterium]|nr:FtsK/SpoIIIE domain-containing protein [Lentisphaeria bacterium]